MSDHCLIKSTFQFKPHGLFNLQSATATDFTLNGKQHHRFITFVSLIIFVSETHLIPSFNHEVMLLGDVLVCPFSKKGPWKEVMGFNGVGPQGHPHISS